MSGRHEIHLTYPKTHSLDEIWQLLDKYRERHPDVFADWIEIERRGEWSDDPLAEINRHGIHFLMEHTKWDGLMALSCAWSDWRRKVVALAVAH